MARHGGHGRGHRAGESRGGRLVRRRRRRWGELLEVVPHEGADHKVLVCAADEEGERSGGNESKRCMA